MLEIPIDSDRYARQKLITWWDQSKLSNSRVLVVGAGALGNEIAKNLGLVGVGFIEIVDMDRIEHSNLARCALFRTSDEGDFKATVLSREVSAMNKDTKAIGHPRSVQSLGIGYLESFDLIIGALDNREARAWVNQACRKLGKFWIDGAIEGLRAIVRTFGPSGPCYACTLTEADYRQMSHRKSCSLIAPEEILEGKTPTNATTASIAAGVQVQEAIKFLVGRIDMMSLVGKCWSFTGDTMDSYVTKYQEDPDCQDHDFYEDLLDGPPVRTLSELVASVELKLGIAVTAIDLEDDLLHFSGCASCGTPELNKFRANTEPSDARCSNCNSPLKIDSQTSLEREDYRNELALAEFGSPLKDIVTLRTTSKRYHYLVQGANNER